MEPLKKRSYFHKDLRVLTLTIFCIVFLAQIGCSTVGPTSISMGRAGYNEAINRTENEQMLKAIVKGRYGETISLLAVSGVAANVRFATNAGVQAGLFGSKDDYAGNIIPFSGGFTYEENPTITYTPVQGRKYLQQIMLPIPLDILVLSIRTGRDSARVLIMLANRINDMRNTEFLYAPAAEPDLRFQRFVELDAELRKAGVLHILSSSREEATFNILISNYAPAYSQKVREYLTLLGLPMPKDESEDVILPIYFSVKRKGLDGIAISTRSTVDLIQMLTASIEIPQDHADAGMIINYPPMGFAGKNIHIHSSKEKPDQAAVAVKYRGYWFYIDDTDIQTKMFYRDLRSIWALSIATAADQGVAPVLTIPVSK